ncbi:MAG TPA: quinoprotein dehydrogenase-associated SoxYZ-like carrier [Methylovirgula sp.]
MMKRLLTGVALCGCISIFAIATAVPSHAGDEDSPAARQGRWRDLESTLFGKKLATPDPSIISLDAPYRAADASLVPITITLDQTKPIKGLYLVIDDNPSPLAAHYTFGPAAYAHVIRMRVRVNDYTNIHAVAEMQDGRLVEATKFVKAAGGCSAPMGMSDQEAMKGMGDMRMKFAKDAVIGKPLEATLMVRHPNFNGMQMNQLTRNYTPARYIKTIEVKDGSKVILTLAADISLSSNPVISFEMIPQSASPVNVAVDDSDHGHWEQSFTVPVATN